MISKISGKYGIFVREQFYKRTLKKCGKNLQVHYGVIIVYPEIEIGDNCAIEDYCIISKCIIGNDVIFAARCSLMSGGHHHDIDNTSVLFRDSNLKTNPVILGDNLWIGTHTVIMNDIASHTVVGANSVVTKKFEPYSVIVGTPAKFSRKRGTR
jgi:acetyltransferase-like isoleucine patch superfamily enzyme